MYLFGYEYDSNLNALIPFSYLSPNWENHLTTSIDLNHPEKNIMIFDSNGNALSVKQVHRILEKTPLTMPILSHRGQRPKSHRYLNRNDYDDGYEYKYNKERQTCREFNVKMHAFKNKYYRNNYRSTGWKSKKYRHQWQVHMPQQ